MNSEYFEVYDLTGSTVAGDELFPLQFDKTEYTPFESFIDRIEHLPPKPIPTHNYVLSVNGKVTNDRMESYLQHPGESSSLLKEALKSPIHYLIARNETIKPKNADHFELGTFCHQAILEPSKFSRVVVEPKCNRGTIQGNIDLIKFYWGLLEMPQSEDLRLLKLGVLKERTLMLRIMASAAGFMMIDEEYLNIIRIVKASFATYGGGILPKIMPYIKTETSMYGTDPATGLRVKIRPDGLLLEENFGLNAVLSVKTTCATSVEAFMRDCAKYRYELAEGMYLDVASAITGRKFTATIMVMCQTVLPYQVAVLYWDAEDLAIGKYKYAQAMDIVKECSDADYWPGFDSKAESGAHGIIQSKLPAYIKTELLPDSHP